MQALALLPHNIRALCGSAFLIGMSDYELAMQRLHEAQTASGPSDEIAEMIANLEAMHLEQASISESSPH